MLRTKLDLRCRGVSITRFEGSRLRLATDAGLMEPEISGRSHQ
jgi:hypothetical protein